MKIGKWRVEFKTTITRYYKNIDEVPFWRLYIVRREPRTVNGYTYNKMIVYYRSPIAMTYDEVLEAVQNAPISRRYRNYETGKVNTIGPDTGAYIVAYPRKSQKILQGGV